MTTLNFATTNIAGEPIPGPQVFAGGHLNADGSVNTGDILIEQSDWIMACIVAAMVISAAFLM